MEKFMLIFHGTMPPGQSEEQMQAHMGKWMTWIDGLAKAGKYVSGEPLLPGGKIVAGSNASVTDGPFVEGKEVVGGYFIINAADMNEAVEISKGCPDLAFGSVQVRQVMKIEMPA